MLEEGLPEEVKDRRRKSFGQKDSDYAISQYESNEKTVLEGILLVIILFNFVYVMVNQTLGHVLKSETCI
jgi:hypothetical protein